MHVSVKFSLLSCSSFSEGVFQYVLNGLQDGELRSSSAVAFEHLCVDCCTKMASSFSVILQVNFVAFAFFLECQ